MKLAPLVFAITLTFLTSATLNRVLAAPANGIMVSPAILRIDLATDSPQSEIKYTNNTQSEIILTVHAENFRELEDNWKIKFFNSDENSYQYSLASWIEFDQSSLSIAPGKTGLLSVQVDQSRLSPGAHYGAIVAKVSSSESTGNVSLNSAITSLIFVRNATGKEVEKAKFSLPAEIDSLWELPPEIDLVFKNEGNVDLSPHGEINVYDPSGTLVSKGIINDNSQSVLPESIRHFKTALHQTKRPLIPGQYEFKATLHYGKSEQTIHSSTNKLYLGPYFLIVISAFIVVVGLMTKIAILKKKKTNDLMS